MFFIFIFCFIFISCSPSTPIPENRIVISVPSDPVTLDPLFATDIQSQKINNLIFGKLFRNENGLIQNDLVKDYQWKFENKIWIELKDLKSIQSIQLNSHDVLFSINRLRKEKGPRKSFYQFIINIEIIDDKNLEITFKESKKNLLEKLSLTPASIYNQKNYEDKKSFESYGLYYLKEWDRNNRILLIQNDKSYTKLPEEILFKILPESSTAIYLFIKNQLDVIKLPYFLNNHSAVRKGTKLKAKSKSVQYIAINNKNPCFDLNFRKALNYAVNKDLIIDKILENQATKTITSIPEDYYKEYFEGNLNQKIYSYQKEKAIELIKMSTCFPEILSKTLDFRMRGDDENRSKGAAIAQYLKDIGLKIKINPMEKVKLYKENDQGKGDLTLLTWFIDYDFILNFIDPLFDEKSFGNGGNRSFYQNEIISKFIEDSKQKQELDIANLKELINTLYDSVPWIFLWSIHENYLLSDKAMKYKSIIEY